MCMYSGLILAYLLLKICHEVFTNISEIVFTKFSLTRNCLERERAFSIDFLNTNTILSLACASCMQMHDRVTFTVKCMIIQISFSKLPRRLSSVSLCVIYIFSRATLYFFYKSCLRNNRYHNSVPGYH